MMNALPVLEDVFCAHRREIARTDGKLKKGTLIGVANGTAALDHGHEGLKSPSKLGGSWCQSIDFDSRPENTTVNYEYFENQHTDED
jgi:hypothetical protein